MVTVLLWKSGVGEITTSLATTDLGWLTAGLALGMAAAMLQANQWRGLLDAFGIPKGYWRCLRLDSAARLFDAALPTSIGGDVMRVRFASDSRSDAPPAALAVALRRVMQIPGLLLLIAVALLASWHLDYSAGVRGISLVCLCGGAVLAVALLVTFRLGGARRIPLPGRVEKLGSALIQARADAADGSHPFRRAALRGLLFWSVVVLSQACYIEAVGIQAPIEYSVAVVTCVNAISMLPISVGGYGLRESAFSALLGVAAVGTAAQGAAVGLVLSAQTLAFGLVGALVYLTLRNPAVRGRHRRVRERSGPAHRRGTIQRPRTTTH